MLRQWINWRTLLVIVAIGIVSGTIVYSKFLAQKIAQTELEKMETWVEAQKTILNSNDTASINLATKIITENKDIPIIETDEQDRLTGISKNLDSLQLSRDSLGYLKAQLALFKNNDPVVLVIADSPYTANKYYYGNSVLLKQVKYYPMVQLIIVALFIVILVVAQRVQYKSGQNQLWAGMAKETAHQLGTPVSSLQGWIEVLKDIPETEQLWPEIAKDVNRLQLVSDRFGKIGSSPQLEEVNLVDQVQQMMDYIKKRAGGKVEFTLSTSAAEIIAMASPPLFDWVIENLLKNALDALEGKGIIAVNIQENTTQIMVEVMDTGKGIAKTHLNKVFTPGFTTKKRGWGIGLALTKRIVQQYHGGTISIRFSEPGKGTCFSIVLPKGGK
jgi:signal transduction histidine kinase